VLLLLNIQNWDDSQGCAQNFTHIDDRKIKLSPWVSSENNVKNKLKAGVIMLPFYLESSCYTLLKTLDPPPPFVCMLFTKILSHPLYSPRHWRQHRFFA